MAGLLIIVGLIAALVLLNLAAWRWGVDSRSAPLVLERDGRLRRADEREGFRAYADG